MLDIQNYAQKFKIKNFRGVYMKDELPDRIRVEECGLVNLQSARDSGNGTHWVAYFRSKDKKYYFDSYAFTPPKEIVQYMGKRNLLYNDYSVQKESDPPICGHLCLLVLKNLSEGREYCDQMLKNCKSKQIDNFFLS